METNDSQNQASGGEFGTLFVVATPIGNLGDMTFRAVETLRRVDVIACEDSRVTSRLLAHYDIRKRLVPYHQHSDTRSVGRLLDMLSEGKDVALVTDAGTPGISDPGNMLVREAQVRKIRVVPIPGASALTTLLSVCGEDVQKFVFLAFPPHKKGRETFFRTLAAYDLPVAFYESSHRILKSLHSLAETVPDRRLVIGRELTKMFEELVQGSPAEAESYYTDHPSKVKGEFVVLVIV